MKPISPQRQIKAAEVASVFNPIHAYLETLQPINPTTGEPGLTEALRQAHCKIEEASFWAVQSVLKFGTAPATTHAPADDENPGKEAAPAAPPPDAPDGTESNATAGNIDPVPADSVTAI
jgi:hypothetical protein